MKRVAAALYGFTAYAAFLLPIGYLVGFLADAGVPKTVDRGAGPPGPPLAVDVTVLLVFGLQHSIMARPGFKRRIERWVPRAMERSTYVLVSGLVLALLFALWRPLPAVLWDVTETPWGALAWGGFAGGIGLAVAATFALSHLHLFGVAQIAAHVRGREHPRPALRSSRLYRLVRHPMSTGLLLAFWSTPRMTVGHLLFAAGMTAYSLAGTVLEERELVRSFPDGYRAYRKQVPALIPILRPWWVPERARGLATEIAVIGLSVAVASAHLLGTPRSPARRAPVETQLERGTLRQHGIDRSLALFEPVDLAFDTVGGAALSGSAGLVRPGGRMVSVAEQPPAGLGAIYFVVEPRRRQLEDIARLVDEGTLEPMLDSVFPLADARAAFERVAQPGKHGKVVLEAAELTARPRLDDWLSN